MRNTLLPSIIDDSFDHMFVVDKRGNMIFFPWGDKRPGYVLKSRNLAAKTKKFYRFSLLLCFVVFAIAASLFHRNFWEIVGSIFVPFGGWYLAYYLYTSKIVKALRVAPSSHKEIILEKLEPEDTEESLSSDIQLSARSNRPIAEVKSSIFAWIQRIWYRLSPAQLFVAYVFIAIFTAYIWSAYHPRLFRGNPADYLVGFFVCLLLGLAGFVMANSLGLGKNDWVAFFQWRLPAIAIMVVFWSFAAWFLYKFVLLIVA